MKSYQTENNSSSGITTFWNDVHHNYTLQNKVSDWGRKIGKNISLPCESFHRKPDYFCILLSDHRRGWQAQLNPEQIYHEAEFDYFTAGYWPQLRLILRHVEAEYWSNINHYLGLGWLMSSYGSADLDTLVKSLTADMKSVWPVSLVVTMAMSVQL